MAKISAYVLPVRQCSRCYRFGHVKTNCKSEPRCLKCGEQHAISENDTCMKPVRCANCLGPHQADDKAECMFYHYNVELNQVRSTLQCSVSDAESIIKARFKKQVGDDVSRSDKVLQNPVPSTSGQN